MARDLVELDRIGQLVGDVLDRGVVRGKFQPTDIEDLKALLLPWERAGGDAAELRRSIAVSGMFNTSALGDPLHQEASRSLVACKQRWRTRFWH